MSVRLLRTSKRMRQLELARLASVSLWRLSHAERGLIELTDDEIARIARALDVPVNALWNPGDSELSIDLVFAGDYAAAVCGPRTLPDGVIQPARTIELDAEAIKSLETRDGKRALRTRLERVYNAVSQPTGSASEPATWSA